MTKMSFQDNVIPLIPHLKPYQTDMIQAFINIMEAEVGRHRPNTDKWKTIITTMADIMVAASISSADSVGKMAIIDGSKYRFIFTLNPASLDVEKIVATYQYVKR